MVATSLKPSALTFAWPPALVFVPTFEFYGKLLQTTPFTQYLVNTLVVAGVTTAIAISLGSFSAYSFTRFRNAGSAFFALFYLICRMLPRVVLVIPVYLLMRQLHLLNTHLALILAYSTFALPFTIWMMIGFFKEIPIELEEAAMVDGCDRLNVLRLVVLPLAAPGLAATSIFAFLLGWNEFLFALVLGGSDSRTLPVLAAGFIADNGIAWGLVMAAGTLVLLPVIVFALVVQRHIVHGMTLGAVKG
jgi:multiple sugar transport system permease protein